MSIESGFPRAFMCYGARMKAEQQVIDTVEAHLEKEYMDLCLAKTKAHYIVRGDREERRMDKFITASLATLE